MTAVEYFGGDELAASVWTEKYALRDRYDSLVEANPDEMHRRLAKEFARVEKGKFKEPYTEEFIYGLLKEFGAIIPQGSPMYGMGNKQFVSLGNCLAGETPVLTERGWKRIDSLAGGIHKIVTTHGKWTDGVFRGYGRQSLMVVTVRDGVGTEFRYRATPQHRWFVADKHGGYKEKVTSELAAGDRFPLVRGRCSTVYLSPQGIQHGIVYGDGTDTGYESRVTLCSPEKITLQSYFPLNRTTDNAAGFVIVGGMPRYYKQRPPITESKSYLMGFLAGWLATDGCVCERQGSVRLFAADVADLHFAKDIASVCGIRTGIPCRMRTESPYDGSDSEVWSLTLYRSDDPGKLLIREDQKAAYGVPSQAKTNDTVRVIAVEALGAEEEVYCAEVPDTAAFVIDGNVLTGNCFVVEPPTDSYGGILRTDEQLAQLCKRRGGVGTDLSAIRPDSMPTTNSARKATGILPFMERFSNTIREVGQNGRRGALMLTISVHHPQVLDFARVKLDPKKVTGANVSIRLTDEFLNAVDLDEEYEQRWPVDSPTPTVSVKVRAREVWREIVKCAHARAEPGLLFWDHTLRESPADCYSDVGFSTVSTNPCSELGLSILDSCRLLLTNLFCCVEKPFTSKAKFSFGKLKHHAYIAQRLMDDLVDLELECIDRILTKIESDPEDECAKYTERAMWAKIKANCTNGRRTGTGITALGDAMAAVGIRYGSDESIEFTEKVYRTLKHGAYRASVDMAKELGPFPIWKREREEHCPFLLRLRDEDPELYAEMQQYGRRNIAALTTAPAGSVSILAGPAPYYGTTSGIEPLFKDDPYTRRKKINHAEKNARVDFVDANGDRWTEFPVYHAKLRQWMDVTGEKDWRKSPYRGCCAEDLDWKQRVRLQAAAQRHIDHSISSTLNLPEDVTVEKVAEIYETAWKAGCKGITVYRKGCRDGVLVDAPTQKTDRITKTTAPKRPAELNCDLHRTTIKGEPCTVFVGKLGSDPYEVFAVVGETEIDPKCVNGVLRKEKRGHYRFVCLDCVLDVTEELTDEQAAVTRLASTALRHGTDIEFIVHQLEKAKGQLTGFSKAIARVLKKYVKDGTKVSGEVCGSCGQEALVRQEGCATCKSCGWSKCS